MKNFTQQLIVSYLSKLLCWRIAHSCIRIYNTVTSLDLQHWRLYIYPCIHTYTNTHLFMYALQDPKMTIWDAETMLDVQHFETPKDANTLHATFSNDGKFVMWYDLFECWQVRDVIWLIRMRYILAVCVSFMWCSSFMYCLLCDVPHLCIVYCVMLLIYCVCLDSFDVTVMSVSCALYLIYAMYFIYCVCLHSFEYVTYVSLW